MKRLLIILVSGLLTTSVYAQDKAAEELVASMPKADMTYRELMETMGKSSATIHEGILRQNKQMVTYGVNYILTHPAPKHKPWSIMQKSDQQNFKSSLLAFDKILDTHAERVVKAADDNNWAMASEAAFDLQNACVSCHAMWKDKVK